jgi:hypothetical protein
MALSWTLAPQSTNLVLDTPLVPPNLDNRMETSSSMPNSVREPTKRIRNAPALVFGFFALVTGFIAIAFASALAVMGGVA